MQDPTEFRKRFLLYKEGKMPYENGLPKYLDGKRPMSHWYKKQSTSYRIPFIPEKRIKLTNAGLATGAILSTNLLDSIADNAYKANIPIKTAIGLATKESTLGNPTDDTTIYRLLSDPEKIEWFKQQGTGQHINNGKSVEEQSLVNYHKGDIDHSIFKGDNNESILKTAFDFYKENPDKYNPGLKNYQKLVNKRGDEVMNSPEVLKWYKEWEDKLIQIKRPEPYKITTNILNTAVPDFGFFKNGKLPGFRGGKGDGMKYLWDDQTQSWDRITNSDVANAMSEWAFTPNITRTKFSYENTPNPIYPLQKNETVSQDNNTWTKKRIEEESNKRTWRSDVADIANKIQIASDIASTVYGASLTNTAKNKVIKPLIRSIVKNAPTTDVERRFIEVMLRSTGGKGSGIDVSTIKNSLLSDKKHSFDVLKYITTGKGDAISLLPGDVYTGFRVKKGWDLPSIKLSTDNKNLGDIIDAILYNRKINPEYGVIPTQEPLFDFGLTPNAIKRYDNVSRYKVKPEYDNSYGFGNIVPPSLYNNITEKHLPIVYDDYGKPTRPASIAVATSNRIGADLGHYDMQIGNLNNYPVYRWQDIYEFNPSAYKKSWDLYNSDFGGDSKTVMRLKNIFLDRLDKAHNPVTIQRDWFSDPFGWPAENYGFTIN